MADQCASSPSTLSGLPTEVRLEIWNFVFHSITIEVQRGPERTEEAFTEWKSQEHELQIAVRTSAKRAMSPLPSVPEDVLALILTCRAFAAEIGTKWHSAVTYKFPSTVAFVDVLSQWPENRVRTLRYVYICDTPFPLYPYANPDCYYTHAFADVLAIFPGLELNILTVENIWLLPSGTPIDSWCEAATFIAIKSLLLTTGWRHLHYVSGILPLWPWQHYEIHEAVEQHKSELNDPDFKYDLNELRPRPDRAVMFWPDGTKTRDEKAAADVEKWYRDHPEARIPEDFADDKQTLGLAMWARRGPNAPYAEDGAKLAEAIKELLECMSWLEVRQTDDYLVDDGLDDSTAHL